MNDRFCAVIAVHSAHRRSVAVTAAQRLAHDAGLPLTRFELTDPGQAHLVATSDRRDVVAVASAIKARAGALVVFGAMGGGPDADRLYDDDAEHLLAHVPLPTLVFGPRATLDVDRPVLLIAADASDTTPSSVSAALAWTATFESTAVVVVGLDSPDPWPTDDADPCVDAPRRLAATLASAGIVAELRRYRTLDPVDALIEAAAAQPGGVLVIPAARFPTAVNHWFSTSRRLIRHAPTPVLLVPG